MLKRPCHWKRRNDSDEKRYRANQKDFFFLWYSCGVPTSIENRLQHSIAIEKNGEREPNKRSSCTMASTILSCAIICYVHRLKNAFIGTTYSHPQKVHNQSSQLKRNEMRWKIKWINVKRSFNWRSLALNHTENGKYIGSNETRNQIAQREQHK